MSKRTNTKTLISALRILANDIQSEDGIANACIAEAAGRLEELETIVFEYSNALLMAAQDLQIISTMYYQDDCRTWARARHLKAMAKHAELEEKSDE